MIASQGAGGQAAVAYNDDVVRKFTVAAVFWGVAAFIANEPQLCVAKGTGIALENLESYKRSIFSS